MENDKIVVSVSLSPCARAMLIIIRSALSQQLGRVFIRSFHGAQAGHPHTKFVEYEAVPVFFSDFGRKTFSKVF